MRSSSAGCWIVQLSTRTAALAYWQGQYVAIDQNEDARPAGGSQRAGSAARANDLTEFRRPTGWPFMDRRSRSLR